MLQCYSVGYYRQACSTITEPLKCVLSSVANVCIHYRDQFCMHADAHVLFEEVHTIAHVAEPGILWNTVVCMANCEAWHHHSLSHKFLQA